MNTKDSTNSIFQNNSQIAAFTKNRVRIGNGASYEIRLNDDADLVVLICLALSVDASENPELVWEEG